MKHKFIILALGLGFLASSCNDLDLVPLSEASTENWYSSEEELLMAANEFYKIGYWNKMNQGLLEQATDNFTYRNVNRCNLLDGTVNGDGGTENWYPVEQWQSNYKCITMANTFLEKSERARRRLWRARVWARSRSLTTIRCPLRTSTGSSSRSIPRSVKQKPT